MDITISHNDEHLIPRTLDYAARESRAVAVEVAWPDKVREWEGRLIEHNGRSIVLLVRMGHGERELMLSVSRIRHLTILGH